MENFNFLHQAFLLQPSYLLPIADSLYFDFKKQPRL